MQLFVLANTRSVKFLHKHAHKRGQCSKLFKKNIGEGIRRCGITEAA